jgi:hypothetical protein
MSGKIAHLELLSFLGKEYSRKQSTGKPRERLAKTKPDTITQNLKALLENPQSDKLKIFTM